MIALKSRLVVVAGALLTAAPSLAQQPAAPPAPVTGWEVVPSPETTFPPTSQKVVIAPCPPGKHVLGGGYFPKNYQGSLNILGQWPSDSTGSGITTQGTTWVVYAINPTANAPSIVVYAICAKT
jgi:hypothetical protein